ncbi:hypothetical protein BKG84_27320, partial [Mycobacteroides chelonae]
MLLRWLEEPSSRDFDLQELVVVSSMTGHEFDSTRRAVDAHVLPRLRAHSVRFVQIARSQRRTTRAGDGIVVLDDSREPQFLYADGAYTLGQEMLSAGTIPQRGGMRACSIHSKGDCLDPVIARITQGRPYRHAIGFEANERARAEKDRRYNTAVRTGFYPLQTWGWSREDCQRYVVDLVGVPFPKSACGFCPFAMSSESGRSRQVERYRQEPAMGAEALFLEFVARSLNPAQTLIENSSAAEMVAAAGLHEVQEQFEVLLKRTGWALYEVRRLTRSGRDGKRGITARSVRVAATGTRTEMAAALAVQPGRRVEGADGVVRHILRERSSDKVDHLFVAAPAGPDSKKQRPGF